jgi:hypothetical protein
MVHFFIFLNDLTNINRIHFFWSDFSVLHAKSFWACNEVPSFLIYTQHAGTSICHHVGTGTADVQMWIATLAQYQTKTKKDQITTSFPWLVFCFLITHINKYYFSLLLSFWLCGGFWYLLFCFPSYMFYFLHLVITNLTYASEGKEKIKFSYSLSTICLVNQPNANNSDHGW